MSPQKQNLLILVLIIAIALVVFSKYKKLNSSRSYNQIDSLSIELGRLHSIIPPNSQIGFKTNVQGDSAVELYFKSAFALAPIVLSRTGRDTTLIVEYSDLLPLDQQGGQVIKAGRIGKLSYKLIK